MMAKIASLAARATALAIAAMLTTTTASSGQDAFELVELDDGIYVAVVDPAPPMYVFANALIVVSVVGTVA